MASDRWSIPLKAGSWQVLIGLDLFRRSCHLAYPDSLGRLPSSDAEHEALLGLEKYIAQYTDDQPTYMFAIVTCLAAELAARNGLQEQAITYTQHWAKQYSQHQYILATMASNRHVAPLLLKGVLAQALGVTTQECASFLCSLQAAVNARMRRGTHAGLRILAVGALAQGAQKAGDYGQVLPIAARSAKAAG